MFFLFLINILLQNILLGWDWNKLEEVFQFSDTFSCMFQSSSYKHHPGLKHIYLFDELIKKTTSDVIGMTWKFCNARMETGRCSPSCEYTE